MGIVLLQNQDSVKEAPVQFDAIVFLFLLQNQDDHDEEPPGWHGLPLHERHPSGPLRRLCGVQDTGEKDTIVGGGIGVAYRIYQHAESRDGFYLEGSISVLFHSPRFEDNTGDVNFLSELGLGYKFENAWHVVVKWEHISNGSTSRKNAGVNSVGLGVGKTF